ncbi:MAG: serine hydrolase domain-containing protein, partial [Ginsengibacter sp.]
ILISKNLISIFFALQFFPTPVSSQGIKVSSPESVGISSARLNRIDPVINDYVNKGKIPGVVALIARHGKVVYYKSFGMENIEAHKKMSDDALFRIMSMTKPITSVAVMTLYEEGKFLLSDPVSKYIPEFKNPKVAIKSSTSGTVELVPAKSEISIRELLNHTSGIAGSLSDTPASVKTKITALAKMPLQSQPGEEFHYGYSYDVLGYLIEVISHMPFDEYLKKHIFEPLKMKDTYFNIPQNKYSRLSSLYKMNTGKLEEVTDDFSSSVPQIYFSGGGGLISKASDYLRFARMILNKGELEGVRILSRKTIELITQNSIRDLFIYNPSKTNLGIIGDKYGYGFGIRTERGVYNGPESMGTFGWDGAYYTRFWIDPKEDMIGIFLSQVQNNWSSSLIGKFRVLAYQAISD